MKGQVYEKYGFQFQYKICPYFFKRLVLCAWLLFDVARFYAEFIGTAMSKPKLCILLKYF